MYRYRDLLKHVLTPWWWRDRCRPDFVVAGAPRSGTSMLVQCLRKHPEVYMSPVKELQYFSTYYHRSTKWYESQFYPENDPAAVGEGSTNYFVHPDAARRMYGYNPAFKLVFLLRNPVERTYSHYRREVQTHGRTRSFDSLVRRSNYFLRPGRYATHLRRFDHYFPDNQVRVFLFERLISAPEEVLSDVYRFLCVDPERGPHEPGDPVNPSRMPHSRSFQKLVYRFFGQQPGDPVFVQYLKGAARLLLRKWNEKRDGEFPELPPDTRKHLEEVFAPEVRALEKRLDRDLSEVWGI